ncbi:hypothetical protein AYO21_02654 [Fonsecaea monophora]|uniref:Uncharacterized protein n=1 Tax=Fonsecaea monophora TaxID=254056 RepID=A0A177FFP8_9EURO|nr:hypothetical protein AYO21_02654 [Fonsecaea monophora]OAG43035.1 hypothetical protein AYO21_02654 [Fonsecaea monophora]
MDKTLSTAVTTPTAPITDRPATPVATGGGAEDPRDNRPLRRPLPNDTPPAPSPSKRAKTAKAKGSYYYRYLRRLRAVGNAAGREIDKGKRGSRLGYVPAANLAYARGEDSAPAVTAIQREADVIDAELRLVETDVAHKEAPDSPSISNYDDDLSIEALLRRIDDF